MGIDDKRAKLFIIFCFVGFGIALVSGAAERVAWLQEACAFFSRACAETAEFTIFGLPVWLWGGGFYVMAGVLAWWARHLVFWVVAAAVGVEVSLIGIMLFMHLPCVFCIMNAAIVALLAIFAFEKTRFWQMLSVGLLALIVSGILIPRQNGLHLATPGEQPEDVVVAQVAGRTITAKALEQPLASRIYNMEKDIFRVKQERLEQLIMESVLEMESKESGKPLQEFVNERVFSDGIEVSDEEVEKYYRENRSRLASWKGSEEELRNRVRATLQQEAAVQKLQDFARSLFGKYGVVISLKEPPFPHTQVSIEGEQALGPHNAPVTIVEFSDYRCPACRMAHETARELRKAYEGKIRWVFKDYPRARHKGAHEAAQAARCVAEQGRFWEYQDKLFSSREEMNEGVLVRYAKELGIEEESFRECLSSGRYKEKVAQNIAEGKMTGVEGTPTFVINSRLIPGGIAFDEFKAIIEEELRKAKGEG